MPSFNFSTPRQVSMHSMEGDSLLSIQVGVDAGNQSNSWSPGCANSTFNLILSALSLTHLGFLIFLLSDSLKRFPSSLVTLPSDSLHPYEGLFLVIDVFASIFNDLEVTFQRGYKACSLVPWSLSTTSFDGFRGSPTFFHTSNLSSGSYLSSLFMNSNLLPWPTW